MKLAALWLLLVIDAPTFASYCGQSAVPYSFQVLSSGQPVLGCARPSCFGWTVDGERAADTVWFYRVNKEQDGFLRKSDIGRLQKITSGGTYVPQVSNCEEDFISTSCDGNDQWVGGIGPMANVSNEPLSLRCCKYDKLIEAQDRGVADVSLDQIVVGGEVSKNGRQYAFDYIANVQKFLGRDGIVSYMVSVRRFNCLPPFTEGFSKVDLRVKPFFEGLAVAGERGLNGKSDSQKAIPKSLRSKLKQVGDMTHISGTTPEDTLKGKVKVVYNETPEYEKAFRKLQKALLDPSVVGVDDVVDAKRSRREFIHKQIIRNANYARSANRIHQFVESNGRLTPVKQHSLGTPAMLAKTADPQPTISNNRRTFATLRPQNVNFDGIEDFEDPQPMAPVEHSRAQSQQPTITTPYSQPRILLEPVQQAQRQHLYLTPIPTQPLATASPPLYTLFPPLNQQLLLFGLPLQQQGLLPSLPQPQSPDLFQSFDHNQASNSRGLHPFTIAT